MAGGKGASKVRAETLWTEGLYRLVHRFDGRALPLWGGKAGTDAVLAGSQKGPGQALLERGLVEATGELVPGKAPIPLVRATPAAARWLESEEADAEVLARCRAEELDALKRSLAAAERSLEAVTGSVRQVMESVSGLLSTAETTLAGILDAARTMSARADALRGAVSRLEGSARPPGGAPVSRPTAPNGGGLEARLREAHAAVATRQGDAVVSLPDLYRAATPDGALSIGDFHAALRDLRDRGVVHLVRPGSTTGLPDLEIAIRDERGYVYYVEWAR